MSTKPLKKKKWTAEDISDQSGKMIVITGANSGLGLEATKRLVEKGATVVMACRNIEKANQAAEEIRALNPESKLDVMELDLSSLKSVDDFASQLKEKYDRLDALVNNAGVMQPPYLKSADGYELQFAVNHLGHFKLTALLFDLLEKTPDARVINQSSIAHKMGKMNFQDINSEKKYNRSSAYGQSKLANLLFTYELKRRVGSKLKAIGVHPGYTNTNLQQAGPSINGKSFYSRLYSILDKMAMPVWKGTLPLLYAVTEDDVENGDYIGPKGLIGMRGYPRRIKSNKRSYNENDARRLWEISEEKTRTKFL